MGKPRVAIACQGGGSHAAFTAGVLDQLLATAFRDRFELTALSGTSGGAVCAALVWAGLVAGGNDAHRNAARRLLGFWQDLSADGLFDSILNFWSVWMARLPISAEISPYTYRPLAASRLRELLEKYVGIEKLPMDESRRRMPKLLIGVTDIINGEGRPLTGETLTYDDIIASAAIPPLYRAVHTRGSYYWDGLFNRNPPIREFTDLPLAERPDEIWVVRLNPNHRDREPVTMSEIIDRRNELSGNLALDQELYFIHKVNELLAKYKHVEEGEVYKPIVVREVELNRPDLDYPSKLDRRPELIKDLMERGRLTAPRFFEDDSKKDFEKVRVSQKELGGVAALTEARRFHRKAS
jgi:NTE family protein